MQITDENLKEVHGLQYPNEEYPTCFSSDEPLVVYFFEFKSSIFEN